jgi:membrane protein YdbS with pleckstrin-like domain
MGRFFNRHLQQGEKVIFETKLSRIVYFTPYAFFTLFIGPLITRATSELVVTNHRVLIKAGWISRHTMEMNRPQIESVDVDQGIIGRSFGYGTVTLVGTGGTEEEFPYIAKPLELRDAIEEG